MGIRERTEQKVFAYIEEYRMITSGDRIVAGVSGGADSLCLLFLLLEYARKVPLTLAVVHVNHGIRPDAGEDARYVEELCRREKIPFLLTEADAAGLARQEKCSQEDAGRRIRYRAFYKAAEDMGGGKIAVAHNRNDNAETMLFHLFRGSGLKGLCGIGAVRDEIIRPILCLERREVEAYLKERGIPWCTDSTNNGDDYSRNRIRHHILPYAEQEICSGAAEHMARTAEMLEETDDYLEQQTLDALGRCLTHGNGEFLSNEPAQYGRESCYILDIDKFQSFHMVLQKRMLHTLIKRLSPTGKDIGQVHIRDTLTLFTREGSRSVNLPFGIWARRQYGDVILERREGNIAGSREPGVGCRALKAEPAEIKSEVWRTESVPLPEKISDKPFVYDLGNEGKLEFTVFLIKKWDQIPQNRYTKWFDCDKIEESLAIRSRRTGDYLTIARGDGSMAHKSLKDYMVTEKIPRQLREEIPVIAAGSHVLWLTGWRMSEYFKVSSDTKRVLQIRLLKEE